MNLAHFFVRPGVLTSAGFPDSAKNRQESRAERYAARVPLAMSENDNGITMPRSSQCFRPCRANEIGCPVTIGAQAAADFSPAPEASCHRLTEARTRIYDAVMNLHVARFRLCLAFLGLLFALLAGCSPGAKPASEPSPAPRPDIPLRLLVVDDPPMAGAIDKLRAEWKARHGGDLTIQQMSADDLVALASMDATIDAILYPSGELGFLAARGWIVPLPAEYASNKELAWSDTFELVQVAETAWAGVPSAVPFGSPVLTCYYRPDLFERFHKRPPRTWAEYHALAEFFSRRENLADAAPAADQPWHGCIEPLSTAWAPRVLLARAAAYVKHRDHYSTLFKIDTMEPLIAGAGFVRALEEMVADSQLGASGDEQLDADAVRREFLAGHAAMALSWPAHSGEKDPQTNETPVPTAFAELPGAADVYDFSNRVWETRRAEESQRVVLLGLAGRLGSVSQSSAHPASAFQLLAWLSGLEWGAEVSAASPATTLFRRSQLRAPQAWLDRGTDAQAARQYATSLRDALTHQTYLGALRIPGREKYLVALGTAVEQARTGQKTASESLGDAAAEWTKITAELGVEAQRKAYCQSLGYEP